MRKGIILIPVVCFLLLCMNLYAERYYVKPDGDDLYEGTSWNAAFATLTKAADVATSGSEVWVAEGTFMEGAEVIIPEGVSFFGGFAGTETQLEQRNPTSSPSIIDGNNSYRCVFNHGLMDGFHVTNGYSKNSGGGILNMSDVVNCQVYNNTAEIEGAGIDNAGLVKNCTVYGNKMIRSYNYGGGIYNDKGTVLNCSIYGNSLNGQYSRGAGIYNIEGEVNNCKVFGNDLSGESTTAAGIYNYIGEVKNCIVYDNISEKNGCGIYNLGIVTNCVIYNNKTQEDGGGIYNHKEMSQCIIYGNQATRGGGIFNNAGKVTNCLLYKNTTQGTGSGIYNNSNNSDVINCTIYRNESNSGYGIYADNGEVINCISWKNRGGDIYNNKALVQYCCFSEALNENGNILANPLFENTSGDSAAWDFHLRNGSPCIDAGTTDAVALPDMDIEGNARPGGDGKVCLGAYESPDEYVPGEPAPPRRLYVKSGGSDEGTGLSWGTALKTISKALSISFMDDPLYEIWVSQGIYQEGKTVTIPRFVSLYGGFDGTELLLDQRYVISHPTIIDGNYLYGCVMNYGIIDGFHITRGKIDGSGGGINNYRGVVLNSKIYGNQARTGGGVYNNQGTIANCTVYCNPAGKGINNLEGNVVFCTVFRNAPGGIDNLGGKLTNCISWKNIDYDILGYYISTMVKNCCFAEASNENGNISANPFFVDISGDMASWDFRLRDGSPCIDAGTTIPIEFGERDIAGNPRPGGDGKVCIGAYESPDEYLPGAPQPARRLYVKPEGDDNNSGTSWGSAQKTINKAISKSYQDEFFYDIWVAKGTYQEGITINIPPTVALYGGFSGSEIEFSERNVSLFETIIDGGNSHTCVENENIIDGFHITNGNPGGITNHMGIVRYCKVYGNTEGAGIGNSSGYVDGCMVFDNQGWYNGGVENNGGIVVDCIVFGNSSEYGSTGGINVDKGEVINCTVYRNDGIGITNSGGIITNCISWKNQEGDISSDGSLVQFCCFGEALDENGNFSADPLFENTSGDSTTWNFRLKNGSPCIDAGTMNIEELPDTDIEGNPRPGGDGKVCMGAYESPDEYLPGEPVPSKRLYVRTDGNDEDKGTSWGVALKTIDKSISISFQDDYYYDIWVAEGIYQVEKTIYIPLTVSVFGGFDGSETELEERDISSHQTIIDGMKKYHRCVENHGVIDGFSITNGKRSDSGGGIYNYGIVANSRIYGNQSDNGGGIYNLGEVINCIVHDNLGDEQGGGISNVGGRIDKCQIFNNQSVFGGGILNMGEVTNCLILNNLATYNGSGIFNYGKVTNCTVYRNKIDSDNCAGVFNYGGEVINCISWKNEPHDINLGDPRVQNSCFGGASNDHGNISANPLFVNTSGDISTWDLRLKNGSPCIDAGTTDTAGLPDTDIDGNPRPGGDGKVCMGAYQSPDDYLPGEPKPYERIYVKTDGNDDKNGTSWDMAVKTITKAMYISIMDDDLIEIWVAKGAYLEGKTICIPSGMYLYGGFEGTETQIDEREITTNTTIIDGCYSYRCVTNYGVIDGFHVTNGRTSKIIGAGIYNIEGTVENCMVYNNVFKGQGQFLGTGIYNLSGKVLKSSVYENKGTGYGQDVYGSGVFNERGIVDDCIIYGNQATELGGGILNSSGLVINSTIRNNKAYQGGGGIYNVNGIVRNCDIHSNNDSNSGGGIFNGNNSIITECIIYQNDVYSGEGGGIYNDSSSTVTLCQIYGNHATRGGGIYNSGVVSYCDIHENSPSNDYSQGIGIYNSGGAVSHCSIHENYFIGNVAYIIKFEGISNNSGTITDCRVYNNNGWGICNNSGLTTNCSVYGNKKGGIYTAGIVSNCLVYGNQVCGIYNNASGVVINCTSYGNLTELNNAGIFTKDTGTVTNSIAWKNQSGDIIGGTIRYCSYKEASNENGNISGNPFFKNTSGDISTWDFHLKNGSPCIDAGTSDAAQMPEKDMEGKPRPGGDGKVCMGAYESPDEYYPWLTPIPIIRFYVRSDGSDEVNGMSWDTALKTIGKVVELSFSDEANYYEIWVAEGLYQEGVEITIPDYLSLYGGFSGTESERDQRNVLLHQTIIDGENAHRCVGNYGILDGFFITQGSSQEGGGISNSGQVTNCRIYMNNAIGVGYSGGRGGGIYNLGEVSDCIINGNHTQGTQACGGGIYNTNNGTITRCIFYDNHADHSGGGVYNYKGMVTNSIFYDNQADLKGGAVYNYYQSVVSNCTLYGNIANLGGGLYGGITNNCISWKNRGGDIIGGTIQNCCYGEANLKNGSFSANPLFENVSGDMGTWNFHLKDGSPCIDAGTLDGSPSIDLEGRPRPGEDGKVCMGAYESPDDYLPEEPVNTFKRLYVKPDGSDDKNGTSWDEALKTIDKASSLSFQDEFFYEIWAAKGTYMEGQTIRIPGAVYLYGGFSGTETEIEQRDWKVFSTIIDGNNTYRCVENFGVMDGIHVTRGNCGEDGDGIYNYGSLNNCVVYENGDLEEYSDGAGIFNYLGDVAYCDIYLNKTGGDGGGICNEGGNVRHCIIYGNRALYRGGGVYNQEGAMTNCLIYDNCSIGHDSEGGGVYNNYSLINNCIVFGNISTGEYSKGGGIYNNRGLIRNSTICGNHAKQGGGLYNSNAGLIANSIIWNNSPDNTYGLYDEYISYSCVEGISKANGNISSDPLFVFDSGDMLFWDYHLRDDSPCIDAGDPYEYYKDGSLPPGKGTERNDMGAYGGPGNCEFPEIVLPKTVLGVVTEYGDAWGAQNQGIPPFGSPDRRGWLGFRFSPSEGWDVLKGDADRSGLDDLIQITQYGDAWVSVSLETTNLEPERWGWLGFQYVETVYNGWIPLAGDVNGDEACDLIQVTEYGDAWVALSTGSSYEEPSRWGWLGYRFNRAESGINGAIPLAGDANGDGLCDLIQITEYTDAWVALSTETSYGEPSRWGWLGFKYAPYDGWYPLCGDVNADGLDDLIQITPTGDPWVSLSVGTYYQEPERWGWLSFYYNEAQGYYPLLGDVNSDGKEDLIQITPSGDQWVAMSLGDAFDTPEQWGWLGFTFSRENGYLPFFLEY